MPVNQSIFSEKSDLYMLGVEQRINSLAPREIAKYVAAVLREHDDWRRQKCLNMTAAENVIGNSTLSLLNSHMAARGGEGPPGDKEFPPARQTFYVDQIEAVLIHLAGKLFSAKYVEWRTISNTMANALPLFAFTEPGDTIMVQALRAGANWSYHSDAIPRIRPLVVEELPPSNDYRVDLPRLREIIKGKRPKFFVVGGSMFLFPFPLEELREIADSVGALILYDAAHVGPLIAGGCFQHPLREGADILTTGTHKMMGGPVGGLVMCNSASLAEPMLKMTFPSFLQSRDQNKFAAAAWALSEMLEFSAAYAPQILANAKALAVALESEGFRPIFRERGYTETHQVVVDVRDIGAPLVEKRCQDANILLHKARLPGESRETPRGGLRIGVQELTRDGMKEAEMGKVAAFIRRAVFEPEALDKLKSEIEEFVGHFQRIQYSFDPQ